MVLAAHTADPNFYFLMLRLPFRVLEQAKDLVDHSKLNLDWREVVDKHRKDL
jgi:hypothetical protein